MVKEKKAQKTGNCANCGDVFIAKSRKRKYCSETCRVRFCEKKKKQREAAAAAPPQQQKQKIINPRKHHPNQTFFNYGKPLTQNEEMGLGLAYMIGSGTKKLMAVAKKNPIVTAVTLGGIGFAFWRLRKAKK